MTMKNTARDTIKEVRSASVFNSRRLLLPSVSR